MSSGSRRADEGEADGKPLGRPARPADARQPDRLRRMFEQKGNEGPSAGATAAIERLRHRTEG
ncbi:hypothetical protein [Streptomyces xanthophaeus]|uniref:hypothetical protein n=1 Tax=Streptomyces xanthophaeus TaxID=67385 RepID=UPI002649881A|nr:hypothetical protein [Streptomyces xanthophaeus]WKD36355.1 hypothetical protein KO717_33400 [Streptomyces xanthophaeus]